MIFNRFDLLLIRTIIPSLVSSIVIIGLILIYSQIDIVFNLFSSNVITLLEFVKLNILFSGRIIGFLLSLALLVCGVWLVYELILHYELFVCHIIGISPIRSIRIIFSIGMLFSLINFSYNIFLIDRVNQLIKEATNTLTKIAATNIFEKGKFKSIGKNNLFFIKEIDNDFTSSDIFFLRNIKFKNKELTSILIAKKMKSIGDEVHIYDGYQLIKDKKDKILISFDEFVPDFSYLSILSLENWAPSGNLDFKNIWNLNLTNPVDISNQFEKHRRLSEPLLPLSSAFIIALFVLLVPYSTKNIKYKAIATVLFGFIILFLFHIVTGNKNVKNLWLVLYIIPTLPAVLYYIIRFLKLRE